MATIFYALGIDQQVQFIHPNVRSTPMIEEGRVGLRGDVSDKVLL